MGKSYNKYAKQTGRIPMNKWEKAKTNNNGEMAPKTKQTYKKKAIAGIQKRKSITWAIMGGEINRQIGYILIIQRFTNCVRMGGNNRMEREHATDQTTQRCTNEYMRKPNETHRIQDSTGIGNK